MEEDEVDELEAKIEELEEKVEDLEEEVAEEVEEELEEEAEEEEAVAYEGENFINLTSPNNGAGFSVEPVEFTGKVSPNTEKIVVVATGGHPNCNPYADPCDIYINDTYTLQEFKLGDESFSYKANRDWDNLTSGTNNYTFTAHFDDGTTQSTELSIEGYIGPNAIPLLITLDSPANGSSFEGLAALPIVFTGSTSKNTTKIVVTATGSEYEDVYTLQNFAHGDTSFIYRAKPDWGNLAHGENNYTFTAHFDDGSTDNVTISIDYMMYY